jgi:cobalt-zinc-cadmium efflux system outer membrane protein
MSRRGACLPVLLLAACAGNGAPPPGPDTTLPVAAPRPAAPEAATGAPPETDPGRADGDALRLAWDHHPRLKAARARILAGHGFETQAGLWPNPEIGFAVRREPGEKTSFPVTLAQRFELGGKAAGRVETAAAQTFLAEAACREAWVAVRAGVKESLARLAFAREALRLRRAILALDEEARDLAKSLARAGKSPEAAALAARERAARSAAAVAGMRALLEDAERQVRTAAGLPPEGPPAAFDAASDATSPLADRFDRLLALAKENSPALAAAAARTAAARAEAALARTRQWSDLVLFVGAMPTDPDHGRARVGWEAGFSVGLPVWDRGQGEIEARDSLIEASREEAAQTAIETGARVSQLAAALAQGEAEVASFHGTVLPAAGRRVELVADAARAGKAGRADLLEETRALREKDLEQSQARLMRATAVIGLERVVGCAWGPALE